MPSPRSDVDAANSIQRRLAALLGALQRQDPAEGWGQFLGPDGLPVYDKIVVAGHSQGGGEAAYIAKVRRVAGVVMFSSIVDSSLSDTPAGWIAGDHLTPLNHYAGFVHVDDPFYRKIRADWTALGLDGLGATDLNNGLPPSGGSHELLMTTPSARGLTAHALPVVDGTTPLCGNKTPQLGPVWRYLMLTAAGLPIPQLRSTC
ncbi:hypothetical protein [Nocardia sp. NRRL WC-3656]|uniref:BPSS1187 family protein n=1 Tax=Nocardia sp. NRRL WC-3656 TaxID=1463824 RepID=UPI0004C31E05|nr:hypothetical protein [Nocardia sp. NRRL WC-3656]